MQIPYLCHQLLPGLSLPHLATSPGFSPASHSSYIWWYIHSEHLHHLIPVTLLYCFLSLSFYSTVIWHCWTQHDLTPSASGYATLLGAPDRLSAALFFSHTLQAVIISLFSSISSLSSFPHYLTPCLPFSMQSSLTYQIFPLWFALE